ncbi:LysR substrate-binding domain-containing protein [Pontivivens insulae]|uniref:Glycine cleavage system transcriptional activator n=1 Tax=Pontivivens insulae TaxID=1639689 RepID=A0A2R8AAJ9_9RHOB|nr:LysR substrate-binding domain-containing protein [Pontivivens insulae]RED13033.1 LysR family glycine cleavage system transcriptional activator [Pontivivens insulae]SPF29125.1 Glycine cleavage system transcriptional activator [Pontivivens insulae]
MADLKSVHLNGLRATEVVLRHGSLSAAAKVLGVTPGAVSQHLRRTEAQLGKALFDRSAGTLAPTALGQQLGAELSLGFRALERAVALADDPEHQILTLSVPPVLAAKWLVSRVADFTAAHPGLRLRIDATAALIHPDSGGTDAGVRFGRGGWTDVIARPLAAQHAFPVCSPGFLAQHPRIESAPRVIDANARDLWADWRAAAGWTAEPGQVIAAYSDAALGLDAAIAGQGLFMAWPTLAGDAIARGQLVRPSPVTLQADQTYWLILSDTRRPRAELRAFESWVKAALSDTYCALDLEVEPS